jgi:glycine/D-amino acid oxidase-like deaminating enzyme
MQHVAIVGGGVVGAMIAYELSLVPSLRITLFDRQLPAQASTGTALGVLMGIISRKTRGNAWAMRQSSIQRYQTLIPELTAALNRPIPHNSQGILLACLEADDLPTWQELVDVRRTQGWQLEIWDRHRIQSYCPQLEHPGMTAAVYSPHDRQIDPTALTLALVDAAQKNGVTIQLNTEIQPIDRSPNATHEHCQWLQTSNGKTAVDWVVIAAGLGSTHLTQAAETPLDIRPVLGQAMHLRLDRPLGNPDFQPVITGDDIHIVPLGDGSYWVGATVEFPDETGTMMPNGDRLDTVQRGAIDLCPALKSATVLSTWSGLRPRPFNRPAPIIERLAGYHNVLLATGHYRNGVMLAPATAQAVREAILH